MWVEKTFSFFFKSNYFSGDLEFSGSVCLCLRDAECPRHLLQPTQTERALSISQDLAVSNKRGCSPYWNTLNSASNLGCLRTLVYSNAHVRDLLFSLIDARMICKLPVRNSSGCPAGGFSCPFEINLIPIPGSVWSRRTFCNRFAVPGSSKQPGALVRLQTPTLWSSAQPWQEFPRRMAACPVSKPGANSWIVTPAKERESQKHKSKQQSKTCTVSFRSEK